MGRAGLSILCTLLLILPCLAAEEYSFDRYLADRGGCSAHRQILDKRLKELHSDIAGPGKGDGAHGIDLFGRRAADWTDNDVQTVLAAFRRCEDAILRASLDGRDQRNRTVTIRNYEVVIAREAARIEETLREIIAADRGNTVRSGAEASGDRRTGRGNAPADRWNRSGAQFPAAETEQEAARLRSPADRADKSDLERARRAEIQARRLEEARREARDREHDRLRAEMPPVRQQSAATTPERTGEASAAGTFAFAPRPVVDRINCVVTREAFDQLQRGMPLTRVEAVIGCRGTLTTTTNSADLGKIEVHLWDDRKTNGTITVQFLNDLVYSKSQVGLN